jgi:hypothetical protein
MSFWLPHIQPLILLCHDYYNLYGMHFWDVDSFDSCTTTKKGHIVIQISSQTTKKSDSENPQFRTRIRRKLLSLCETLIFALVQSQALRNSRN